MITSSLILLLGSSLLLYGKAQASYGETHYNEENHLLAKRYSYPVPETPVYEAPSVIDFVDIPIDVNKPGGYVYVPPKIPFTLPPQNRKIISTTTPTQTSTRISTTTPKITTPVVTSTTAKKRTTYTYPTPKVPFTFPPQITTTTTPKVTVTKSGGYTYPKPTIPFTLPPKTPKNISLLPPFDPYTPGTSKVITKIVPPVPENTYLPPTTTTFKPIIKIITTPKLFTTTTPKPATTPINTYLPPKSTITRILTTTTPKPATTTTLKPTTRAVFSTPINTYLPPKSSTTTVRVTPRNTYLPPPRPTVTLPPLTELKQYTGNFTYLPPHIFKAYTPLPLPPITRFNYTIPLRRSTPAPPYLPPY